MFLMLIFYLSSPPPSSSRRKQGASPELCKQAALEVIVAKNCNGEICVLAKSSLLTITVMASKYDVLFVIHDVDRDDGEDEDDDELEGFRT